MSSGKHFHNVLCLSEAKGMDITMKEKYSDGIEWNTYEKLRKERPELFAESTQIPIVTDKGTVDTFV